MNRASAAVRKLFAHRKVSDPISDVEKSLAAALSFEARTRVSVSAPPAAYILTRKTSTDFADSCDSASVLSGSTIFSDALSSASDGTARGDPAYTKAVSISGASTAPTSVSSDNSIRHSSMSLRPSKRIAPDTRGTPLVPTAMGVLTPTPGGGSEAPFDFGPAAYAGPSLLRRDRYADVLLAETGARTEVLSALAPRQRVVSLGTAAELARARAAVGRRPAPPAPARPVPVLRLLSDIAPGVRVLPLPPRLAPSEAHALACRAGIDCFAGPETHGRPSSARSPSPSR